MKKIKYSKHNILPSREVSNSSENISRENGENRKKICPSEAQESYALMIWASYHPICNKYLIAIPNGGSRNKIEALNLKRAGVKAGVSDYLLPYPITPYHGLWIELKRRNKSVSKLSKEQIEWLDKMKTLGYDVCVAYGWEEARDKIKDYLKAVII